MNWMLPVPFLAAALAVLGCRPEPRNLPAARELAQAAPVERASAGAPAPVDGGDGDGDGEPERTAVLCGIVRDVAGVPVRGARVSAVSLACAATAITGDDGAFALAELPESELAVVGIAREGNATLLIPRFALTPAAPASAAFVLQEAAIVRGRVFVGQAEVPAHMVVRLVRDAEHAAVIAVLRTAQVWPDGAADPDCPTEADGSFCFPDLAPGPIRLRLTTGETFDAVAPDANLVLRVWP